MRNLTCLCTFILLMCSCIGHHEEKPEPTVIPAGDEKSNADTVKIKLEAAIKAIAMEDLKTGGFTIEYLLVDSLTYNSASLKDYYLYRKDQLDRSRTEYRNLVQRLAKSGSRVDMDKYRDDSLRSNKADEILTNLIVKADTTRTIYRVNYHLNARTNTTPYNSSYTKYLFIKDLSEVKMHFGN